MPAVTVLVIQEVFVVAINAVRMMSHAVQVHMGHIAVQESVGQQNQMVAVTQNCAMEIVVLREKHVVGLSVFLKIHVVEELIFAIQENHVYLQRKTVATVV